MPNRYFYTKHEVMDWYVKDPEFAKTQWKDGAPEPVLDETSEEWQLSSQVRWTTYMPRRVLRGDGIYYASAKITSPKDAVEGMWNKPLGDSFNELWVSLPNAPRVLRESGRDVPVY